MGGFCYFKYKDCEINILGASLSNLPLQDLYKSFLFGGVDASIPAKLVCGGMTGMSASILTYPLDLIRTMLSVHVDNPNMKKPTIVGTGVTIF